MPEALFIVLVLLACPIAMGLMMWYMTRYQRANQPGKQTGSPGTPSHVGREAEAIRLQAEIDQLKAAERDSATRRKPTPPEDQPPSR